MRNKTLQTVLYFILMWFSMKDDDDDGYYGQVYTNTCTQNCITFRILPEPFILYYVTFQKCFKISFIK